MKIYDNERKNKKREVFCMKKFSNAVLKAVAGIAFNNAKKETESTCTFIGYQPKMPEKVYALKNKK